MPPVSERYPYPRINGLYSQHSSIQLMINGVNFYDVPEISGIGDSCEPTIVRGLSRVGLGMTPGNSEAEDLQISFFGAVWPDVEVAIDPNNIGIYDVYPVTIHMEISERGIPKQVRDWVGLKLSKASETSSYSSEPLKMQTTWKAIALLRNGRSPVSGVSFGYVPNQIQVGSSV